MSDQTSEQNIAIKETNLVKATANIAKDVSTIETQHHDEILLRLDAIDRNQLSMKAKLDPIYDVFTSVKGFNRVTIVIMKGLAMVGGTILSTYVVIEFFKKIGK